MAIVAGTRPVYELFLLLQLRFGHFVGMHSVRNYGRFQRNNRFFIF